MMEYTERSKVIAFPNSGLSGVDCKLDKIDHVSTESICIISMVLRKTAVR